MQKIEEYCENNPIKIEWDYMDSLTDDQIKTALSSPDGLLEIENDLIDWNLPYLDQNEPHFVSNMLEELDIDQADIDENEIYPVLDVNLPGLLNNTPPLTVLIYFYSNLDCCNSFDDPFDPEGYAGEIYNIVKPHISKEDYEYEFANGVYGGSLFCFACKMDIEDILEIRQKEKDCTKIKISAGTQFGFFSSWQGSGSLFNKRLKTDAIFNLKTSDYDYIGIMPDICQHYNMMDVYGDDGFIDEQLIELL